MTVSRQVARPLMSSIFFVGPVNALREPSKPAKPAEPVTARIAELAQKAGVPLPHDPELMVRINAGIQLAGATALATGRCPRLAAGVLAATLVPTTLAGHRFWEETDPATKAQQRLQFAKNLSILGGLIVAAVDTDGKPGKAWLVKQSAKRMRKQADRMAATAKLEAKIAALEAAGAGDTLAETLTSAGQAVRGRAHELGEYVGDRAPEWAATARDVRDEALTKAQEYGGKVQDTVAERGPGWVATARDVRDEALTKAQVYGGAAAGVAAERASDWGSQAADATADVRKDLRKRAKKSTKQLRKQAKANAEEWRKEAKKRGKKARKELAKRSDAWLDTAQDTRDDLRKQARASAKDLRKQAKKRGKKARKQWAKQSEAWLDTSRKQAKDLAETATSKVA